jgi:hypothetical protein
MQYPVKLQSYIVVLTSIGLPKTTLDIMLHDLPFSVHFNNGVKRRVDMHHNLTKPETRYFKDDFLPQRKHQPPLQE